jgi:hypothetical protein
MKPVVSIDQTYKNTPGGLFVPYRNPIEVEARRSTAVSGDAEEVKSAANAGSAEAKLIWYSLGISVGVVLLLVWALKAKVIKL